MLSNLNQRQNNVDATLDQHTQRQDFKNKRQIVRVRKSIPTSPTTTVYARVRWDVDLTNNYDASEGQLVDSSGTNLSPTVLIWIDSQTSPDPEFFGTVFYEVEKIGSETRNLVTRDLYRIVRLAAGSGTGTAPYELMAITGSGSAAKLRDVSSVDITTTINGVAGVNRFEMVGASGASFAYDLQYKPKFRSADSSGFWHKQIMPDHIQRGRMRTGVASNTGTASISATVSIDNLERFDICVYYALSGTGVNHGAMTFGSIWFRCYNNAGALAFDGGHTAGAGLMASGTGGIAASTKATSSASPVVIALNNAGATVTAPNMAISISAGADGRITSVTVAGTAQTPIAFSVFGGRPTWTGE